MFLIWQLACMRLACVHHNPVEPSCRQNAVHENERFGTHSYEIARLFHTYVFDRSIRAITSVVYQPSFLPSAVMTVATALLMLSSDVMSIVKDFTPKAFREAVF
ncbi:hypothetical protein [Prevotella nigrescens]|uniref:hypothetical protein n=1 Tax=Prevotella nigrescens TaxID=28133 RepID=UPI001C5E36C9|nr:hypothetical protein [Prevotella nigrescens]